MKKLFKEVWKSLSKTKSLIVGLTVLIFLSSGVFTLLNDVKYNYSSTFDDYKKISKIHDLTVDTEINATGEKPNNTYIENPLLPGKQNFVSVETIFDNNKIIRISQDDIEIDPKTQESYLKISKLGIVGLTNQNYIKISDLYRFFQSQNIINFINPINQTVNATDFNPTPLEEYIKPGVSIPETCTLKVNDKIINFISSSLTSPNYTFGDLITIIPGVDGFFSSTDDRITNVKNLYINAKTKESTISQTLKSSWEKEGILITISSEQVARLLGFKRDTIDERGTIYSVDPTLNQQGMFMLVKPSSGGKWRLGKSINQNLIPGGFSLNLNNTITNDIVINNINQFFVLNKNFIIPKNWLVTEKITYEYERHHLKINFDFNNPNAEINKQWTKNYKEYISSLNKDQIKYYYQTSYWKKIQVIEIVTSTGIVIDPNDTIRLPQAITYQDLNRKLKLKSDVKTNQTRAPTIGLNNNSILWMEKEAGFISQTEIDATLNDADGDTSIKLQSILNNSNSANERIQAIDSGAKEYAKKALYQKILDLVGSIDNIGLRENLTVAGFNNDEPNTFHFVNAGNSNQEVEFINNINIKQNVGKLYNEEGEKSLLFELNSNEDIKEKVVPIAYVSKILETIFSGLSVDKNYINLIITFENYEYFPYNNAIKTNSQKPFIMNDAKIIRMKDTSGNIFGITKQAPNLNEENGKYFILKEQFKNGKKIWVAEQPTNFLGTPEDLDLFIKAKNLNFANIKANGETITVVGNNGWAQKTPNYDNKYFIPFKILVPSTDLTENWNESNNFDVLEDKIINSLTEILKSIISESQFKILIESVNLSFTKYGFADIFDFPSELQTRKLEKIIFGIFHEAAKNSDFLFWNNLLDEILGKIISNTDPNYISDQIGIVNNILKTLFGNNLNLDEVMNFIKDPKEFLIGLRKIIASVDIDKTIITIWNNFYDIERPMYEAIGTGDILPILLDNIISDNSTNPNLGFKAGLKQIVSQVNFSKIIKYLKENVLDAESLALFGPILDQLNGNMGVIDSNPENDYLNINIGINKLIDLINLNSFNLNIKENSKIRTYLVDTEDNKTQEYTINSISISGIAASLLSSLGENNDSDLSLHNAIIELLNISSKTKFVGFIGIGVYQPESDPNKLDLLDLTSLLKSPTPELNNLNTSLKELSVLLEDPNYYLEPNSIVGKYLTNYIFNFAGDISIQNKDIKKRVDAYLEFMSETSFINFDPTMKTGSDDVLGGMKPEQSEPNSLADKFIQMINPNVANLNLLSTTTYKQFYNSKNPLQARDMMPEILNFFSFWIKLSKLNLDQTSTTTTLNIIEQINLIINNTLDPNSHIGKILNKTSQSFNPNVAMNYKILDGFSNVKKTANDLAKLGVDKLVANGFSQKSISYYFDSTGNYNELKSNFNTISLVSSLSSIISVDNQGNRTKANLISQDFTQLFLPNDKEKAQIMLDLGERSLNMLVGSKNLIIENVGISSVIMNPFNAVLNTPTLLWFTINQNATSLSSPGNLAYIIKEKLYNFNSQNNEVGINYGGFKGIIDTLLGEEIYIDNPGNADKMIAFSLDIDYLDYLKNNVLVDPITGKPLEILNVNFSDALTVAIDAFTETKFDNFKIIISDIGSYLTKVNSAYLKENGKEIFIINDKNIPTNSIEMEQLIKNTDDKFKINVNGLEFLIIGADSTIDYLYPVTDINNIQVNTKTQAIMYVNQAGFDRVRESNANASINKYFLLQAPSGVNPTYLRDEINKYIYESTSGLTNYNSLSEQEKNNPIYKKAFLYNETNLLKPEISLRLQTIESLISTINSTNLLISSILIVLIAIVTIFIIKRYISSRSKVLGILKAQGYKSIQIAISICLFPLIVAVFGATIGYIVGHFLQIPMMNVFAIYWTLPITPTTFNLLSLIVTVFSPLLGLILMTIFVTIWILRIKPNKLMDGSFQLNNSKSANIIKKQFKSRNIKSKFTLSLSLNSIWKLIALLISLTFTVTIMSFSFSSRNAFGNAVSKTYKNRNYDFKMDFITPTLEGGSITTYDNQDINNLLYVPTGNPIEGLTTIGDYFKPGPNSVINYSNSNGNPTPTDKHIITKSSFDFVINTGGVEINVWDSLFNSLPDSQKSNAIEISQYAARWLEWTQELDNYGTDKEAKYSQGVKIPYFKYLIDEKNPENSKFVYKNINDITGKYFYQNIIISSNTVGLREKYRDFLVSAYNKAANYNNSKNSMPKFVEDYLILFGAVIYDNQKNEKFSYALTKNINNENHTPTINGFNPTSTYVKIVDSSGQNLLDVIDRKWSQSKETIPIVINHVVKNKWNLNVGSTVKLEVLNTTNRYTELIRKKLNLANNSNSNIYNFEIVGIDETFINEEWTTSQKIINEITLLNKLDQGLTNEIPFNGILSTEKNPRQAIDSLGLYSKNGYWSAEQKIDLYFDNISPEQQEKNVNIFRALFYKTKKEGASIINDSVFANTLRIINPNFSEPEIESLIKTFLTIDPNVNLEDIIKPGNESIVNKSLSIFSELYGSNDIISPSFVGAKSKNIESGFISNTTSSINDISTSIIVLSFLISVTILIMISTLIISENEKNIAIFSILGYTKKEKIILFFSLYIPIIVLAIVMSIPLSIIAISSFISITNTALLISLPMSLGILEVILPALIVFGIFLATSLIAWLNLSKIKPIILLKGE